MLHKLRESIKLNMGLESPFHSHNILVKIKAFKSTRVRGHFYYQLASIHQLTNIYTENIQLMAPTIANGVEVQNKHKLLFVEK